jgi:hypothetical protein
MSFLGPLLGPQLGQLLKGVAFNLKQKLPTMAAVGDMPNDTRNINSIGSGHEKISLT